MSHTSDHHDLTTGPIARQLWSVAWPSMLSMFFFTLYNIVDAYWVSKLSADAIAAVSISQITLFAMISVGFGITIGSGVIMSMDIGAKNKMGAEKVLGQSFVLMAIAALLFTTVALLFREKLLLLSGATGGIFAPALEYFTITSGGSVLFFILIAIMFSFNAQGETFTLTKLFAVSTAVNIILDPVLIFGWGGAPALGIAGAGYSTLISQLVFIIIGLWSLSSPQRTISFHFRNLCFHWESVKQVLLIGIPAAMTQVLNPIGIACLTLIAASRFAEPGSIAFSLGFRIEFFAYLPAVGYGVAAMAMIGQSIGARKLERSKSAFRLALLSAVSIALVLGLVVAFFGQQIVSVFTTEQPAADYAILYMRTVALSYAFLAAMMVEANAFQALGRSWPGFWIMFIRFVVISIPLSFVLTTYAGFSIIGIWIALMAGNVIAAVLGYLWITRTIGLYDFHIAEDAIETSV